jgi:predicted nucleic acid-binding protein
VILVDTSIWVDHLRRPDARMAALLDLTEVLMHRLVFGELAMGDLRPREPILHALRRVPELMPARDSEVLAMIERERLYSSGIGYADAHLLAAVKLAPETLLWTRDKRLRAAAERLSLAIEPDAA